MLPVQDRLQRPLQDLRLSVMDRCNFRCPYCMPREHYHERYPFLDSAARLSFAETVRLVRLFTSLGVRKVRLTGGEPLLRPQLHELVAALRALESIDDIALTTNGALLSQQAVALQASGLQRVTVSLDALDVPTFTHLTGGFGNPATILAGIDAAQAAQLAPIKINAVIQRGVNEHAVFDLLERFRGTGVVVRFIEYMDVGNRNHWRYEQVVPAHELRARIHALWPLRALATADSSAVATRYAFADGAGEVGFIASVTQPFCGHCSRARLSSEGVFYTCLFATTGTDLKTPLRAGATDAQLLALMQATWAQREDQYSALRATPAMHEQVLQPMRRELRQRKIEMYYIGG